MQASQWENRRNDDLKKSIIAEALQSHKRHSESGPAKGKDTWIQFTYEQQKQMDMIEPEI